MRSPALIPKGSNIKFELTDSEPWVWKWRGRLVIVQRRAALLGLASLLIGMALRFGLAVSSVGSRDQQSWAIVSKLLGSPNFYLETSRYGYPPLWAYILWGLRLLQRQTSFPFHVFSRGFLSLIDLAIAYVILLMTNRDTLRLDVRWAAFYLLNPVAMLTSYQGQFDVLALLPLLIAVYLMESRRPLPTLASIWALGTLSVITKHITLFAVWALYHASSKTARKAVLMMLGTIAVFGLVFVPYLPQGLGVIMNNVVFRFQVPKSPNVVLPLFLSLPVRKVIFYLVLVSAPALVVGDHRQARAVLFSLLCFLIFSYLVEPHYYLLPVALATAMRSRWVFFYSMTVTAYLLGTYFDQHFLFMACRYATWMLMVVWSFSLVAKPLTRFPTL